MTDPAPRVGGVNGGVNGGDDVDEAAEQVGPVVRDRRRLDPDTGQVRQAYARHAADGGRPSAGADQAPAQQTDQAPAGSGPAGSGPAGSGQVDTGQVDTGQVGAAPAPPSDVDLEKAVLLAEERLADLQRLQAEYVNYRRRVERDRDLARQYAVAGVLEALLPVLDDVHLARQHGDLETGPFAAIADKLETTLNRFGLSRYGEPGETFDPTVHEALMHTQAELAEGTAEPTVVQVLQPGYRLGDRVLRPARVAVADPPGG